MIFSDRREAGRKLGEALGARPGALILGIPRGGVIVAREVAVGAGGEHECACRAEVRDCSPRLNGKTLDGRKLQPSIVVYVVGTTTHVEPSPTRSTRFVAQ